MTEPAIEFERKGYYSPREFARIVSVDPSTVLDWIHSRRLYAVKLGPKTYRIPLATVLQRLGATAAEPKRIALDARGELRADERKLARRHARAR